MGGLETKKQQEFFSLYAVINYISQCSKSKAKRLNKETRGGKIQTWVTATLELIGNAIQESSQGLALGLRHSHVHSSVKHHHLEEKVFRSQCASH